MKAIVHDEYGAPDEVLELREIERPTAGEGEVLVRVAAAPIAGDDWHLVQGLPYVARLVTGLRAPKTPVPGRDLAGTVEAVGAGVTRLRPGDEVFGWCEGAFAEYAAVPEENLANKPAGVSFEAGMTQFGGHAIYLNPNDIQLGARETVADAARNLERWVDAIAARTFKHETVI